MSRRHCGTPAQATLLAPGVVPVVSEAKLRETRFGLAPDGEGWFVVNAYDMRWRDFGPLGVACDFEGKRPSHFRGLAKSEIVGQEAWRAPR
jgi:hypothetical protein